MEIRSIKKIAVIGAESTGKTRLCEELARHFQTQWVPEYARDYFNHSDIYNYTLSDLEKIAQMQVEWERQGLQKAHQLLFCDTALITLKIWAELEFGTCPDSLHRLMEENSYDFYLIANNDVEWEKDPQRLNRFSREKILRLNIEAVHSEGKPYEVIKGLQEQRLLQAIRALDKLFKF